MSKKLKGIILNCLGVNKAYAETVYQMSTATNTSQPNQTQLTDAIRTVYAKEIEYKALPQLKFEQFATKKTELGVTPGLTISMMRWNDLTVDKSLKEGVPMGTQSLSSSMKSITVTEYGKAVKVSELLLKSSFANIMQGAVNLLSRNYALRKDTVLRDVALKGTNIVYARNKAGEKTADRQSLTEDCTLKVSTIKDAVEVLATNNAPKRPEGCYICFVHPHQSRALRDDPAWINASNYGAPTQLFTGEIGKIDDVRFIETTIMCNGGKKVATDVAYKLELQTGQGSNKVDVYQAVIFGLDYYGLATSLPVQLRDNEIGRAHV